MGNHLYHEAASQGNCTSPFPLRTPNLFLSPASPNSPISTPTNYQLPIPTLPSFSPSHVTSLANARSFVRPSLADEIIDLLLDQPSFECDPPSRTGDTPLHTAIRWLNNEPPAQRTFGLALIEMMLEAGSNPRLKTKGGLSAYHLVDPANTELRDLIQKHEYAAQNAGDFITASAPSTLPPAPPGGAPPLPPGVAPPVPDKDDFDEDAEFSGSDEEERVEWERRRKERRR